MSLLNVVALEMKKNLEVRRKQSLDTIRERGEERKKKKKAEYG